MSAPRKTVLITGCKQGGIGNALAREFHAKGLRVFATARSATQLSDLSVLGIETFSLDVTHRAEMTELATKIASLTNGTLDVLVNNAGIASNMPALDVSDEHLLQLFNTNLFSVMRMVQEFSALILKAKGTIVNVGSIVGLIPYTFSSTYNAAKAALHIYSDTLRVEVGPFGVKVMVLITGGIKSNLVNEIQKLPPNSLYQPINAEYTHRQQLPQRDSMPNAVFARGVVKQVLKKDPVKWYWNGTSAWLVWVLTFLPMAFVARVFKHQFGMDKLARYVNTGKIE